MAPRRLVVFAFNFAYSHPVRLLTYIRNNLGVGQELVHFATQGTSDAQQRRLLSALGAGEPVGAIGISIPTAEAVVAAYKQANAPIVLIDEAREGASSVAVDNYRGGVLAGQHLVKAGRNKLAVVCGRTNVDGSLNAVMRLKGFRDALTAANITLPANRIYEVTNYSYQEGREVLTKWLTEKVPVDAIFCAAGDDCATGILRVAQEHGVRVPADLAVIGFDDLESAKSTTPPLTTIRQPLEKIARHAYELASDPGIHIAHHPHKILLDPELIVRGSA